VPFALATAEFVVWLRWEKPNDRPEVFILQFFPWVVLGMIALVMVAGSALQGAGVALPVMAPEHSRNFKFIYLTPSVWMAFALAGWLRYHTASRAMLKWGPPVPAVFLRMIINLPGHKLARHLLNAAGWWPEASARQLADARREDAVDYLVALNQRGPTEAQPIWSNWKYSVFKIRNS